MNNTTYNSSRCLQMKGFIGLSPYKKGKNKNKLNISVWHSFDKEMGIGWGRSVSYIMD